MQHLHLQPMLQANLIAILPAHVKATSPNEVFIKLPSLIRHPYIFRKAAIVHVRIIFLHDMRITMQLLKIFISFL